MATQVEKLILLIEDVGVEDAEKAFEKARKKIKQTGDAAETAGKKAKGAGVAFKQFRGASSALTNTTGQLSVQVQDVAVQLESGTDAVRVFAQQGPQIAAIFGPQGALFGALLAVGALVAGPFVRSWFAASEALDENNKKLKEYTGNLTDLTDAQKAAKLVQLTQEIIKTKETIKELAESQKDAAERQKELADGSDSFTGTLSRIADGFDTVTTAQRKNRDELITNRAAIETQQEKLTELQKASQILMGTRKEETKELKQQKENLEDLNAELDKQIAMLGMSIVEQKVYNALQNGATAAEAEQVRIKANIIEKNKEQEQALKKLRDESDRFIQTIKDKNDKLNKSQAEIIEAKAETLLLNDEERELVQTYIDSIEKKERNIELLKQQKEATRELIEEGRIFRQLVEDEQRLIDERAKKAKDAAQAKIDAENEALEDIRRGIEEEDKYNEERRARIAEYNRMMVEDNIRLQEQEAKERKRIAEQNTDGLLALEDKLMKGKTEKQKLGFRTLVNLSNAERRQNAINIVSDSYAAAMGAWKALAPIPIVGPALGAAAAAGIIAGGASYAAQSISGGRALGGQVRAGESYIVGERGPEVLTMGTTGKVIPNDKLKSTQPSVNKVANVTFNIQANDTAGFDQLLVSRRGQIVSIINRALEESGRGALV